MLKSHGKTPVPQLIENQLRAHLPASIRPALATALPGRIAAAATPGGGLPREVCLPLSVRPYRISEGRGVQK